MKKHTSIIICLFLVSFLCAGCGPSKEEKNEDTRKKGMGSGDLKIDGSPTKHGGI